MYMHMQHILTLFSFRACTLRLVGYTSYLTFDVH